MIHNKKELVEIANWLVTDLDNIKFNDIQNIESDFFMNDVEKLLSDFNEYPKDMTKIQTIMFEIQKTNKVLPLYIEKKDPFQFVFKGRHRMVALYLLGFKSFPVCYVEKKKEKNDLIVLK